MRRLILAGAAGGVLCAAGYVVDGSEGAVAISVIVTVAVALGARLAASERPVLPPDEDRPARSSEFSSYRKISAMLRWTQTNGRYFETVTRPFLVALTAALLADRHGIDYRRNVGQARQLIGPEGWQLIHDDKPRARDDPVALGPLAALVERLEEL